jgi:hypothetical protein
MAFDLSSIQQGANPRAPLIVIHGAPEAGKTTFAAGAPAPIFIRAEDGLGINDVPTFPVVQSIADVMSAIESLYGEHSYKTLVIDSLSALEPLIWEQVAKDQDKDNIEDIGFGRGHILAMDYWRDIVKACMGLAKSGITPVLIAHSEIVKFDPPDGEAYDRYQIKLHKRAFAYLYEQADIIGFAHKPVYVKKAEKDDRSGKAKSKGNRILRVSESPAVIAKNRFAMPDELPLQWSAMEQAVPFYNQTKTKPQTTTEE